MAETVPFDASTRTRVLAELSAQTARVHIRLSGAAADLVPELTLRFDRGRVLGQEARAMLALCLASSGVATLSAGEATDAPAAARWEVVYAEAQAQAASLRKLLEPVGELDAILAADLARLAQHLGTLPDPVSLVLKLADGRRSVGAVLRDSPYDEALTARILERLVGLGVLRVRSAPSRAPEPPVVVEAQPAEPAPVVAPIEGEDEFEGAGVVADIRTWLAHEEAPDSLLSDDLFISSYSSIPAPAASPRAPEPRPLIARSPAGAEVRALQRPAPASASVSLPTTPRPQGGLRSPADEEILAEAGVASAGNRWIVFGAFAALVIVLGLLVYKTTKPSTNVLPDATVYADALVWVSTATKSSTIAPDAGLLDSGVVDAAPADGGRELPPIAGPDAPEEVRRAEALLNQGALEPAGKLLAELRVRRANDPTVWVLSGQYYVDAGKRLSLAEESADKALSLDPKHYRAWVLKGSVLQFSGKRKPAAAAYAKAIALEPDHLMSPELRSVVEQLQR